MNLQTPQYEKPRGAVLYFDYWKFAAPTHKGVYAPTGQCSLNLLISQTFAKVQMPNAMDKPELDQMEELISGHMNHLVRNRGCPTSKNKIKKCEDCRKWLLIIMINHGD